MSRFNRFLGLRKVARIALAAALGIGLASAASAQSGGVATDASKPADRAADEKAIRASAEKFLAAFRSGDAKAVAAAWTEAGEYINDEGIAIRGRAAIEKAYIELFKSGKPKEVAVKIDAIHFLSRDTAVEDGTFTVAGKNPNEVLVSRYGALHVRENGGWRMASLREWAAEPAAQGNPLTQLAWLVGKWSAKGEQAEVSLQYSWLDEGHNFLENRFKVTEGGKSKAAGVQIIGRDPNSGLLRSWTFDSRGTLAEALWTFDKGRWLIESTNSSPDGEVVEATNLMIPGGPDAFTWQSLVVAENAALAGVKPIKVVRVK
ncbi:MAG: SgcJ/EcaC family oxidoreductase [Pirellulales bacterium]|nr:SgcJ/EcaC family oxidoreductase [Pirellulales bacterium]